MPSVSAKPSCASRGFDMGLVLTRILAWLGPTGLMIAGIVVFYEGLPLGPLRLVPLLGPALESFADGRVDSERKAGALAERQTWEELRRREGMAREAERLAAQAKIDGIETEYWRQSQLQSFRITELERALETEPAGNPACGAPVISKRLRDALNAVGR